MFLSIAAFLKVMTLSAGAITAKIASTYFFEREEIMARQRGGERPLYQFSLGPGDGNKNSTKKKGKGGRDQKIKRIVAAQNRKNEWRSKKERRELCLLSSSTR